MAKYIYKLAEIVMFVLSSNPAAVTRMKKERKNFFKGKVIRETAKEVWIEPLNKDLAARLEETSFFRVCIIIDGKRAQLVPPSCEDDNFYIEIIKDRHGRKNVRTTGIVIIPKKQVDHFYGEKRRLYDAMDQLINSDLVKVHNKKKKGKKAQNWVYKV